MNFEQIMPWGLLALWVGAGVWGFIRILHSEQKLRRANPEVPPVTVDVIYMGTVMIFLGGPLTLLLSMSTFLLNRIEENYLKNLRSYYGR